MKCSMIANAGATVSTTVYVVKGGTQSLLGLVDGKALGIISICPEGKEETVRSLSDVKKVDPLTEGVMSGGQTQQEIDEKLKAMVTRYPKVFEGLGQAKVEPIHLEVDPTAIPIQQKQR